MEQNNRNNQNSQRQNIQRNEHQYQRGYTYNNYQQNRYGYNQYNNYQQNYITEEDDEKAEKLSKIALILSVTGLICCCISWLFAIPAIICAIIVLVKDKRNIIAWAAIIISIVSIVICTLLIMVNTSESGVDSFTQSQTIIKNDATSQDLELSNKDNKSEDNVNEKNVDRSAIDYQEVSIETLLADLNSNALKAETTYQDAYIKVSGILGGIDSDGSYISIYNSDDTLFFEGIQCYLTSQKQREAIMKLNAGSEIIIKGQITTVGEVIGYGVDVHSIEYYTKDIITEEKDYGVAKYGLDKYLMVSVSELYNDLDENALRAENTWQDQLVYITGKLNNIDSDGSYISIIDESDESWGLQSIQCYITTQEQLDSIMEMKIGDTVVVRGQIHEVGELLGYSINIEDIHK